ncbi:hypothetical protein EYF80_035379 [Liparis tanakae]|uniref:Uncharacterized protein n=1 Tax=Liparis tanakae TaxID=230148 RepID=A0A4Z2GMF9_9TELE|nr:hypothetical protein EYF80_035379 [Liparis tanakae]
MWCFHYFGHWGKATEGRICCFDLSQILISQLLHWRQQLLRDDKLRCKDDGYYFSVVEAVCRSFTAL